MTCDTWHVTHDMWHVTRDMWHVTHEMWHMTCDMWHVTPDTWYLTYKKWWGVNILLNCQLPSFHGLGETVFWRYFHEGWHSHSEGNPWEKKAALLWIFADRLDPPPLPCIWTCLGNFFYTEFQAGKSSSTSLDLGRATKFPWQMSKLKLKKVPHKVRTWPPALHVSLKMFKLKPKKVPHKIYQKLWIRVLLPTPLHQKSCLVIKAILLNVL